MARFLTVDARATIQLEKNGKKFYRIGKNGTGKDVFYHVPETASELDGNTEISFLIDRDKAEFSKFSNSTVLGKLSKDIKLTSCTVDYDVFKGLIVRMDAWSIIRSTYARKLLLKSYRSNEEKDACLAVRDFCNREMLKLAESIKELLMPTTNK